MKKYFSLINPKIFQYIHDGSDSVEDKLVLVARTQGLDWPDKDKTSVPATLKIVVDPVNDAIPRLVNNTGLTVWAGSSVTISTSELGAEDKDSPDTNLTFSISSPHCGMVSLVSRPAYPVSKFSQHQLANQQVLFTHTGTGGVIIKQTLYKHYELHSVNSNITTDNSKNYSDTKFVDQVS